MKITGIILLSILIFSSCIRNSYEDKTQFHSFLKKLRKIETPVSFNSNDDYQIKLQYLRDDPFFMKIDSLYGGYGIFGILFETEDFVAILGNIPTATGTPIITTFDSKGNKIETHSIYENVIGDIGIFSSNFETIYPDMTISFIDSTKTLKLNEDGSDIIPGTDSLSVKKLKYKINNNGKFLRIE
jgi:hypothetical protein